MIIDYTTIDMLTGDLDLRVLRNELTASNIANVDTPGYKSLDLEFTRILDQAAGRLRMMTTDPRHLPGPADSASGATVIESTFPGRADGNNVQIEDEMLKLTQNSIKYNVSIQLLTRKLNGLKNALMDARR